MRMTLGENIRRYRKEKGITQEELAAFFDVSFQSISKWERGECYPDITMLPGLANFFGVTVDALLGMGDLRNPSHLRAVFTRKYQLEAAGRYAEAVEVLREAARDFPGHHAVMSELALALTLVAGDADAKDTAVLREAIQLSENVLANSGNEKVKSTTRANLCFLYLAAGDAEKAESLGRTLPHCWESREWLLPALLAENGLADAAHTLLAMLCARIGAADGKAESIVALEKMITLGPQEAAYRAMPPDELLSRIGEFFKGLTEN